MCIKKEVAFLIRLSASRGIRELIGKERLSGMHGMLRVKVSSLRDSLLLPGQNSQEGRR